MPRGIYDRSKTKEQRAVEKSKADKKDATPKRKYTKRVLQPAVTLNNTEALAYDTWKTAPQKKSIGPDADFFLMGEARNNLATLMNVSALFGDLPSVKAEVDAHVEVLGQFRKKLFIQDEAPQRVVSDDGGNSDEEVGADDQSVAPAPIPSSVQLPTVRQSPMAPITPVLPAH